MSESGPQSDECFILIKAQPHRSSAYFETVCCAGIGRDGKWRRQYPVPFRILDDRKKFGRWNWISYQFTRSPKDTRSESQKVDPDSLVVGPIVKPLERAIILNPLVRNSFAEADEKRESLTLLRPTVIEIEAEEKSDSELADERAKHAALANQLSIFDNTAKPLKPCRMKFRAKWKDQDGKARSHECDDWETSAAFNKFERKYGASDALKKLKQKYEEQYFNAGLVMGFSTHSRRNQEFGTKNQWLLVGLIRLDPYNQGALGL